MKVVVLSRKVSLKGVYDAFRRAANGAVGAKLKEMGVDKETKYAVLDELNLYVTAINRAVFKAFSGFPVDRLSDPEYPPVIAQLGAVFVLEPPRIDLDVSSVVLRTWFSPKLSMKDIGDLIEMYENFTRNKEELIRAEIEEQVKQRQRQR